MDCAQARATLWPSNRPQLAADEVVEARRHVEDCPACQRALAYDATLLSAFERLREEALLLALRERVLDLLARTRSFGGSSSARTNDAWYRRHLVAFAPSVLQRSPP